MSPYFSLSSKRSEVICPEMTKTRFLSPTVVWRPIATQPPRVSPWTLYRLKADSVGYIFAADSIRLSSFKFSWRAPKDARSTSRSAYWPFKVIRGRWFSCHLKRLMRLPISSISHRFWDTTTYRFKIANFPYPTSVQPQIWKCFICTRSLKFCVWRAKTLC